MSVESIEEIENPFFEGLQEILDYEVSDVKGIFIILI